MKRHAIWVAALFFSCAAAVGAAKADRGFGRHDGFHERFESPRHEFFEHHRFFRHRFFFHSNFFFRPFFFFGAPAFAPVPFALYPPLPYPTYIVAPAAGTGSCYQYQTLITIDGQAQPAWGTACLQPNGTWLAVP